MTVKVAAQITTTTSVLLTNVCNHSGELKNEKRKGSLIGTGKK